MPGDFSRACLNVELSRNAIPTSPVRPFHKVVS